MPLDAICLSAVLGELRNELAGSRIEKIYQPDRNEIILQLRGAEGQRRLLLSASPGRARVHFTEARKENPQNPPMFCMLLRKHIGGARISGVSQPELERVVIIELDCYDEMGSAVKKQLVLEAIGRSCNIILVDENGRIIDCIRRSAGDVTSARQMLPGLFYRMPPPQDRKSILDADEAGILEALEHEAGDPHCDKWIQDNFFGMSPLVCRELAFRAGAEGKRLSELNREGMVRVAAGLAGLKSLIESGGFVPYTLFKDGEAKDYSFMPIMQYGGSMSGGSSEGFSELLESFYAERDMAERIRQRGRETVRAVTNARDRIQRKLVSQRAELDNSQNRDKFRRAGDIITANLYRMRRGMTLLRAEDFYDPECREVEIMLDPLLSPQHNAEKYYKDYTKAKSAEKYLTGQIKKGEAELEYLESALDALSRAEGEQDLREIRAELEETGVIRRKVSKQAKAVKPSGPIRYRSSSGLRIAVGRNNTQNDLLTMKTAFKTDIWLHTQKIHGSHVILFTGGGDADEQSLLEAAMLAALHSQAKNGENVPVDYTPVRFVKKPPGARPGMVIYETYNTMYVTPDAALAESLRE